MTFILSFKILIIVKIEVFSFNIFDICKIIKKLTFIVISTNIIFIRRITTAQSYKTCYFVQFGVRSKHLWQQPDIANPIIFDSWHDLKRIFFVLIITGIVFYYSCQIIETSSISANRNGKNIFDSCQIVTFSLF